MNTVVAKSRTEVRNEKLVQELNQLLADYQLYYHNLRGFHWNVKGHLFFQLHDKFEDLYREASEAVDVIAERIRALGATPLHTIEEYFQQAQLSSAKNISKGEEAVSIAMKNSQVLLYDLKEVLHLAESFQDEATITVISELITETEKRIWMLKAFLG
ncbi:starvation-inducible DNA-binding protein [Catalinimonas alkaloidigena]|uniref:Dps family protein n=1 Tax=Catalinimonas alkaloidigena TaxID=1075417 RepID=UPI0024071DDB|nr:Dps family protein [Catalinimonas alkaloidigena]MDF9798557.1 starvation-inducible DNA-binding protein [Catalinimonas alkaloidigena]